MDSLCLENQLCFKLYALSRQMTLKYRAVLEALNITYPQYLALLVLWEERKITVKELGHRLYLDSGTLTPLLKRLEQKGLLLRQRDPGDERSVIISLTKEGAGLKQKAKKVPLAFGECLSLKAQQHQQLKDQLDQLLQQLGTE